VQAAHALPSSSTGAGSGASSTQTSATPQPETPKAKMATEMTDEEYKKAKADIIKRNR
jgi:hypothetical protein